MIFLSETRTTNPRLRDEIPRTETRKKISNLRKTETEANLRAVTSTKSTSSDLKSHLRGYFHLEVLCLLLEVDFLYRLC